MMKLINLKMFHKLMIPTGILTLVTIAIVWQASDGIDTVGTSLRQIVSSGAPQQAAALRLTHSVTEAAVAEKNAIIAANAAEAQKYQGNYEAAISEALSQADQLIGLSATPERRAQNESLKQKIQTYAAAAAANVARSVKGDKDAAIAASVGELRTLRAAVTVETTERVETSARNLQAEADRATRIQHETVTALVTTAAIGLSIALALLISIILFLVVRPLAGATLAVDRLAAGDLAIDIQGAERLDEVGRLARGLRIFRDKLQDVRRLEAEQVELKRIAAEAQKAMLNRMADDFERSVKGVVDAVASSATELRTAAESMSSIADETTSQSAAVAAAVEETSANVQTVAAASEELAASITEISRQVSASSRIASQAVGQADQTGLTVRELATAADKIGEVVRMIHSIATQTNLLALNATIEAACAGDAGKGFAVVASEVKVLANQTAQATQDIQNQVEGIQGATARTVDEIGAIGGTIQQISEFSTAIAAAIEEQGAATGEITRNVQQAASGTQEVAVNIANVSMAANETGAAATQVRGSAIELSQQAERLRTEVATFIGAVRAA